MRRFILHRYLDVNGLSGTGPVVEGVQFTDGTVAMRWVSDRPSTVMHESVENVISIHGHAGLTKIVWMDPEP